MGMLLILQGTAGSSVGVKRCSADLTVPGSILAGGGNLFNRSFIITLNRSDIT